jgi:AAA+ superfamily predicted ATPase
MSLASQPVWSKTLARRWNSETNTVFILHGNIYDIYPVSKLSVGKEDEKTAYVSLKGYLARRIFHNRKSLLFYDISEGLSFGSADMQADFTHWLSVRDEVSKNNYATNGVPTDFNTLAPILKDYFQHVANSTHYNKNCGSTLIINFPEKVVPSAEESSASKDERQAVVTLIKWATSIDMRAWDVGVLLVTETSGELHPDLLSNPHVAQIEIGLPDQADRLAYIESEWASNQILSDSLSTGGISASELGIRTSGLNLVRLRNMILEAIHNNIAVSPEYIAVSKKRLIEEFCQGLVRFKEPVQGRNLDMVATHKAAKEKLRELAWLIKNGKNDVLEKGVLIPGRVGVGKSWLVDCFASECGLPVLEMGEFRSKWLGDSEKQQARVLLTLKALGPVVVVVDEADQVFGSSRDKSDGDSGVGGRVFAAFAAHIGDSSLRGRELWFAMTSRPDLLAIDMKRQGRFGLCVPLFPAQDDAELKEIFTTVATHKGLTISEEILLRVAVKLGDLEITGSEVESVIIRAMEKAVLAGKDKKDVSVEDFMVAIDGFIDPLDPNLIQLQVLAGVLACSDRRYLPARYSDGVHRDVWYRRFEELKALYS